MLGKLALEAIIGVVDPLSYRPGSSEYLLHQFDNFLDFERVDVSGKFLWSKSFIQIIELSGITY